MNDARTRGVVPPAAVGPRGLDEVSLTPVSETGPITGPRPIRPGERLLLDAGWDLRSAAGLEEGGDVLSTTAFAPAGPGWHPVTVPTTVFAALVARGLHPDPYFGMNLREAPGMGYPIAANFSNLPMPADSPFASPWWYRRAFTLPPARATGDRVWLHLDGINYRAAVWLNGRRVDGGGLAGALRTFTLDVTAAARPGETNVLAIEVTAPKETDLGITFVDWNPSPPDRNMGIWREVYLTTSGPATLRHPAVTTQLGRDTADLTITALVENATGARLEGTVTARLQGGLALDLSQPVTLAPGERREVTFTPEQFPALRPARAAIDPHLWWPAQMGTPRLADLTVELQAAGALSDRATARVGLREITSELTADNHRVFLVNGRRLLVRGAGWAPDLMLRPNAARVDDELLYARDIGLNTVRLEGKMEDEGFFAATDRLGLLVMAGWCCCDHWERWPRWSPEDHVIAEACQRSQLLRLRSHPSLLAWLNGSDNRPPPEVESRYLAAAREARWPNPVVSSGTAQESEITGPSGLKMTGPYDYVAPSYWLTDDSRGGAHGFNTETSMGPAIPPVESLRRMLPAEELWPIGDHWRYHAGGGPFRDLAIFLEALAARHGIPRDLDDLVWKAELMAYEGVRAMFEAYGRNKYRATGVIQWMLNNAWPSVYWHLYDHLLRPGAGYFGAKKACQPLSPVYGYDDGAVWLVSSRYQPTPGLTVTARLCDLGGRERAARSVRTDAAPDSTQRLFPLPLSGGDPDPISFLHLTVTDDEGKVAGSNFYWLSRAPEVIAWDRSTWYTTPTASFADFTALARLPSARVTLDSRHERLAGEALTHVTVHNAGPGLAFFVRLVLGRGPGGEEVLPVRWDDNYLSLLPGETRQITARYRTADLREAAPSVRASGWNVGRRS